MAYWLFESVALLLHKFSNSLLLFAFNVISGRTYFAWFNPLNLPKLILWLCIWYILGNISCVLKNNVYSAVISDVLYMSVRSNCSRVLREPFISLIFFLVSLLIIEGGELSPQILFNYPLILSLFCCMYFGLLLGTWIYNDLP